MNRYKLKTLTRVLLMLFAFSASTWMIDGSDAWARAGRGRSIGRPSGGGGFGFRRSTPPPASRPAPSYNYGNRPNAAPSNGPTSPGPTATPPPASTPPSSRGGFLKGLAGGIAGGFLGSMLFSSLGHGSGLGGGFGGGGGGGFGFLELILLGGLAYLGFRWWKSRQTPSMGVAGGTSRGAWDGAGASSLNRGPTFRTEAQDYNQGPSAQVDAGEVRFPAWVPEKDSAMEVPLLDKDYATDLFFRVQGAWTRRDLKPVMSILGPELEKALSDDLQDLLRKGEINRLENISVRSVETLSSWTEGSTHFATVRFVASLLDYTVDEKTGRVSEGSDTEPVKFQEDWTFSHGPSAAAGERWRVVAIEQVN